MKFRILLGLAMLATSIGMGSAAADANCYKISKMKYKNRGAYSVKEFIVKFIGDDGKEWSDVGYFQTIDSGQTKTIDLSYIDGLEKGYEAWGKVKIDAGDNEDCRKDGTKFYYNENGGTVTYKTKGTTLNNNRCTLNEKPADKYKIDCP